MTVRRSVIYLSVWCLFLGGEVKVTSLMVGGSSSCFFPGDLVDKNNFICIIKAFCLLHRHKNITDSVAYCPSLLLLYCIGIKLVSYWRLSKKSIAKYFSSTEFLAKRAEIVGNSYVFLRFFLGVGGGGVNVNSLMVVETPLFFFPGDLWCRNIDQCSLRKMNFTNP